MSHRNVPAIVAVCVLSVVSIAGANWFESFETNPSDLAWDWQSVEAITYGQSATFAATRRQAPDGNHYIAITESKSAALKGAAFGVGFVSEPFTDVRIGAVVNVTGDATANYQGFGARASYFAHPQAGGVIADAYIMHINWEAGPANLSIDVEKVVQIKNMMRVGGDYQIRVPGYLHRRSYYAQLDIVGADPTYVTGALYEYEGGPLVARLRTLVDTAGNDYWEDPAVRDAPFMSGVSGVFAQNERPDPAGFNVTFDNIFSVSDGPAAVPLAPADAAADVSLSPTLTWVEAAFAASHVLWFGPAGDMQPIHPEPAARSYAPGPLRTGVTYQWRVDQIGPSGTVEGPVSSFTTIPFIVIEDFESYPDDNALRLAWDPNLPGASIADANGLNCVDAAEFHDGAQSMRIDYQNQKPPYYRQMTRAFAPQDWTAEGMATLMLAFRGKQDNAAQSLTLHLGDAGGHTASQTNPDYARQSDQWHEWHIDLAAFANAGVDLTAVNRITLTLGDGTPSGQGAEDVDTVYIDAIRLQQPQCYNAGSLDLRGDVNGDCAVNLRDLAITAAGWLNSGLANTP
ncbi:MAG: hypothetical protein IH624_17950 [Phycisphaerae bacterium]|nr:hypothetical protein [Phycisphaerae bacterium]